MFVKCFNGAVLLASLALAGAPAWSQSAPPPTPTSVAGAKIIGVDEARSLADGKSAQFYDMRTLVNFGKGHVPGAASSAYKEESEKTASFDASQDRFDLSKLPADKNAKLVFYSDGPTGWKSYKASVIAAKAGYKNVLYMRGGFAEWTEKKFPVER
jgi:rhodanese-related sulfurtransferase